MTCNLLGILRPDYSTIVPNGPRLVKPIDLKAATQRLFLNGQHPLGLFPGFCLRPERTFPPVLRVRRGAGRRGGRRRRRRRAGRSARRRGRRAGRRCARCGQVPRGAGAAPLPQPVPGSSGGGAAAGFAPGSWRKAIVSSMSCMRSVARFTARRTRSSLRLVDEGWKSSSRSGASDRLSSSPPDFALYSWVRIPSL